MRGRAARIEDISQGKVWPRLDDTSDRYIAESKLARRVLFTLGLVIAAAPPPPPLISGAESKRNGGRRGGRAVWLSLLCVLCLTGTHLF